MLYYMLVGKDPPQQRRHIITHTSAVFDAPYLLEHILSFVSIHELLTAAFVNDRWKGAARSDMLWKPLCRELWKSKWCMSHVNETEELPLFWRSYLSAAVIDNMTVKQLRAFYKHPLLDLDASDLNLLPHLEENMMRGALQLYMTTVQNHGLQDLWFASYSLSRFDGSRADILDSELCSPRGFDTYFKIDPNDVTDEDFLENLVPYEDDTEVLLYPHSICYFGSETHDFTMELREADLRHITDLKWARSEDGSVRVGPYPSLQATRQADWGWKLENMHVVLYARSL